MNQVRRCTRRITPVLVMLFALLAGIVTVPVSSAASPAALPGHVALGDSIDFGVGSSTPDGWVGLFAVYLAQAFGSQVDLHNLAVPGAETKDINLEQLPAALQEVANHNPYGVVVSYGGGGNDLRHFIESPEAATCLRVQSCLARLNALLNEAERRVDLALAALRAAGPSAEILVRTQYNALMRSGCALPDQVSLGNAALEGAPGTLLDRGLNVRLRDAAQRHGAKVIDIFGAFFVMPDTLISTDCIHPTDTGYAVITAIAITALGP